MEKWRFYALLAHPFRLGALEALARDDLTAGALARLGGVSASAASNQLAVLVDGGLVDVTRSGRERVYALRHPELARYLKRGDVMTALAATSAGGRRPRR